MTTAECKVTTSYDQEHVIVKAKTATGRDVQLIVRPREAMTLADDLTRCAERVSA